MALSNNQGKLPGKHKPGCALTHSFLGERLEAEKRLEQQQRAIEIEAKRLILWPA